MVTALHSAALQCIDNVGCTAPTTALHCIDGIGCAGCAARTALAVLIGHWLHCTALAVPQGAEVLLHDCIVLTALPLP